MLHKKIYLYVLSLVLVGLATFLTGKLFLESITKLTVSDFHVYYYVPKMVITDVLPTHPYISYYPIYPYFFPPASIPLLFPLSQMPFYLAKIVWTLLNFGFLFASLFFILKTVGKLNIFNYVIFLIASLIFYPVIFTLRDGQFNIVLLFIYSLGLFSFTSGRFKNMSALMVSVGIVSKISPGILLVYALFKKQYKYIFISIVGVLFLMLLAEIYVGPKINYYYVKDVISKVSEQSSLNFKDQSLLSVIKNTDAYFNLGLSKNFERFISYSFVVILLTLLWFFEKKHSHSKFNDLINISLLCFIAVTGTGLTWFHQYSILLMPLMVLFIISLFYLKKYRTYFLISFLTIYSLWAFEVSNLLPRLFNLEFIMFWAGLWFLLNGFILKSHQNWFSSEEVFKFNLEISDYKSRKFLFVIALVGLLIGTRFWELNTLLAESRDFTRIEEVKYMGKVLAKGNLRFQVGESNSTLKSNRIDRGYALLEKDEFNKVISNIRVLYLDPINNEKYNYKFKTTNGRDFELSARLESLKFVNEFGEEYKFIFNSAQKN